MAKLLSANTTMSDPKKIYIGISICSVLCIGAIVFVQQNRSRRLYTEKAIIHPQINNIGTILPDQIQYQRAKQLIEQNKIQEAIQALPNQTNTDKKNQAILWTYIAEQQIQKDTLTGRQLAQKYADQANQILQYIGDQESSSLQKQNQSIMIAACIQENIAIQKHLSTMITIQSEIQSTIQEIKNNLATKQIPTNCKTQLTNNIDKNLQILDIRSAGSKNKLNAQKQTNRKIVSDLSCDIDTTPQQYQITTQAMQQTQEYLLTQQGILYVLQQNPADLVEQLCHSKNDSQLDNQVSKTMEELLGSKIQTDTQPNNQVQYQDIDQDIQNIIQQTQNNSTSLIKSIQQTIHSSNYNPTNYINKLFQQFFGNIQDFTSP